MAQATVDRTDIHDSDFDDDLDQKDEPEDYFSSEEFGEKYPSLASFTAPLKAPARDIIGRDHEISQLMASMSRPELCNALLLAPPGSGKALANGTVIAVNDARGYVPIEDLVVGDEVFEGVSGEPTRVSGVFPQGKKAAYRVTVGSAVLNGNERSVVCNDEHLWSVSDMALGETETSVRSLRQMLDTKELDDGDVDDAVFYSFRWWIPVSVGGARRSQGATIDPEALAQQIHTNGESARLPDELFNASHRDRDLFVGHYAKLIGAAGSWLYVLNEALGDDFVALARTLGVTMNVVDWVSSVVAAKLSGIDVSEHEEVMLLHAGKSWVEGMEPIGNIEDLEEEVEMTCIKVEAESELFQAGREHIVTHNTALVQSAMLKDTKRIYLEVDLAGMIAGLRSDDEMASRIKKLFDDAERYSDQETSQDLVLFIDEFHQIMQISAAAVEALKPVLAASGARGIRIIAATTFEEFHQHIAKNQPLVERLQRINLNPPNQATTIQILHGMAARYGVGHKFLDNHLFEMIYEYTNRYMPSSTQPRSSLKVLDAMVGWHRETERPMDKKMLAEVLMESTNVNVAFRVDAVEMKNKLDKKVFSQNLATSVVAKRLQLCVADLHDKTKPMSSFLFTGPTGTGKTELTKQLAHMLFGHDQGHLIRFDMSEYANEDSLDLFRSELTKRVWNMGHAVLLLDEIEKAASSVVRVMLQVLDDGRLSDDHGRQVSFLNTYIIMTTNAGSEIYETIAKYNVDDTGSGEQLMSKMREIKRSIVTTQGDNAFPPELMGRIDAVVPFQPLSRETQRKIVSNKLLELTQEVLTKHAVRIKFDPKVLEYLIENKAETEASAGGARDAIGKMTDEVTTNVAAFINAHPRERLVRIEVQGVMKSEDKKTLISGAHIEVFAAA